MISISNLHKSFGKLEVLKGIDLQIREGEVVVIIGSSGTGKSTLLRCMNYLEKPNNGRIRIGEASIEAETATPLQIKQLRSQSAMVFQNYNLFKNMTVLENIMLNLCLVQKIPKEQALIIAGEYLEVVHLTEKANEYPSRLSGGQQQRVAIARAMAMNPKIYLFDEPTAALDPTLTGEVMEVIRDLAEKKSTMLVVTHSIPIARDIADRVVFMSEGVIVAQGSSKEILLNPEDERLKDFLRIVEIQ